jgi:hypothetical protein
MGWPQGRSAAEDGGGRLSCLARNGRSGVPARPVAWGGLPGEESRSVRRCVSGDRGAAVLRPDQAMERPRGPHAEQHSREKRWRTSNALYKRPGFPGEEKEPLAFRKANVTTRQSVRTPDTADGTCLCRPPRCGRQLERSKEGLGIGDHADAPHSPRLIPTDQRRGRRSLTRPGSRPPMETLPDLPCPADRHTAGQAATFAPRPCRRQGKRRQSRRPHARIRTARRYGRAQTSRGSLRWRPARRRGARSWRG